MDMVLPDGFALPPLPYLFALLVAAAAVGRLVLRRRPTVRESTVLAFVPWMIAGAAAHVLDVIDAVPPSIAPLLGAPSVYVSTFVLAGLVWAMGDDRVLGLAGTVLALAAVATTLAVGYGRGTLTLFWPTLALACSIGLAAGTWAVLGRGLPGIVRTTGVAGAVVVLGHVLDGVSTAVGIDVLEVAERSPLPRAIMDVAAGLPTSEAIGVGWLFVLVKVLLAAAIIWLMAEYVEDAPGEGYLLLGAIAAVGFGPGVHNLLLFAVGG